MIVIKTRHYRYRYVRKIGLEILFFGLLGLFWIAVISLGYIAVYRPQDFVNIKPLEADERYPFIYKNKSNKPLKCEHYEYFTDFQRDKPLQNIWITLIWSIVGVVVSLSTLYGIITENPHWLDSGVYYLFLYAIHKAFMAGILFLIKCPGSFLFKFFVLTEPLVALLHILDVAVSVKLIHLILMAVAIFLLTLVTRWRNNVIKKNLKKRYESKSMQTKGFQSNLCYFDPILDE